MFAIIHFRLNARFFGSSAAKIERIFHNAKYFEEIFDFLLIFYAFSLLFAVFLPFLCVFLPACNQCTVSFFEVKKFFRKNERFLRGG